MENPADLAYDAKHLDDPDALTAALDALLSETSDLFLVKDRNLAFLRCSETYCRLHNRRLEDIIGKTDVDIFPREAAEVSP